MRTHLNPVAADIGTLLKIFTVATHRFICSLGPIESLGPLYIQVMITGWLIEIDEIGTIREMVPRPLLDLPFIRVLPNSYVILQALAQVLHL